MRQINISIANGYYLSAVKGSETITPELTPELTAIIDSLVEHLEQIKTPTEKTLDYVAMTADDETLLDMQEIFPAWEIGKKYAKDTIVNFNGDLWRILQAHTSQADWLPPDAVSLYVRIVPPGVIEPWRQPQGAHDAYQKDDKVTHKDKTWISTAKDNVWEPGVYGWDII